MAFAFVQSNSAEETSDADGTVAVNMTVTAGNLIVAWVKYESDADNTATCNISDGTTAFTMRAINHYTGTDLHGVFGYLLAANGGAKTYTATISENVGFKWIHVREYSYTGTASFDTDPNPNSAEGSNPTNPLSDAITTTGTDEVVIGGVAAYSSQNYANPVIGGSAASNGLGTTGTTTYTADRILTATMTGGTFTVEDSVGPQWVCSIISFKAEAASTPTVDSWGPRGQPARRSKTMVVASGFKPPSFPE